MKRTTTPSADAGHTPTSPDQQRTLRAITLVLFTAALAVIIDYAFRGGPTPDGRVLVSFGLAAAGLFVHALDGETQPTDDHGEEPTHDE